MPITCEACPLLSLRSQDAAASDIWRPHLEACSLMRKGPRTAAQMGAVKVSTSVSLSGSSVTAHRSACQ